MRRIQKTILSAAVVLGACGQPVIASDTSTSTSPTTTSIDSDQDASTSSSSPTTTTGTLLEETSTTMGNPSPATTAPPLPNRPPVIEDVGATLSIAPTDTAFTLRLEPVATDPDGGALEFSVSIDGDAAVGFGSPFETPLPIDSVLSNGEVALTLAVTDGDLRTEESHVLGLQNLEVVGSASDITFQVTNPGTCFFALGSGGMTTVERPFVLKVRSPLGNVLLDAGIILSAEKPSVRIPGFETDSWGWDDFFPHFGHLYGSLRWPGVNTKHWSLAVPYQDQNRTHQDEFKILNCDFRMSATADFNLSLSQ